MARGARVAPSVFSFDTNSTHAIWPVPRGSGIFSPSPSLVQLSRIIPNAKSRRCLGATQPSLVLIVDIVLPLHMGQRLNEGIQDRKRRRALRREIRIPVRLPVCREVVDPYL